VHLVNRVVLSPLGILLHPAADRHPPRNVPSIDIDSGLNSSSFRTRIRHGILGRAAPSGALDFLGMGPPAESDTTDSRERAYESQGSAVSRT